MITLSPQEIIALLLEVDKNDVPTDALQSSRHKLEAEYRRLAGRDPELHALNYSAEERQETKNMTEYQASLIDGYYALDPDARVLGFFKGQPVLQAFTAPIQMRGTTRRNIVVVSRDGGPKNLPLQWMDNFIPASGVTWTEAQVAIEDWHMHSQKRLSRE